MPLDLNADPDRSRHQRAADPPEPERLATLRALNDLLRREGLGRAGGDDGWHRRPAARHSGAILQAVSAFDAFDGDNDPHDEHDFALLEAAGQQVMFKVDSFDRDLAMHSPDPADPTVTARVMTILLAEEY